MIHRALRPKRSDKPDTFMAQIDHRLCVGQEGRVYLFGGAGLGLAVSALEQAIGRSLIWSSAQYLSFTTPGVTLTIEVQNIHQGRHVTQARAILREDEKAVLTVNAALGAREGFASDQWSEAPVVPAPMLCSHADLWPPQAGKLHTELEIRLPPDGRTLGSGRMTIWVRSRKDTDPDAALLAVFGDIAPAAVAAARASQTGGNSLDNTLRVVRLIPTEWVLCDFIVDAAHNGFAHVQAHLYAQDGTLMGVADQTIILRE